MRHASLSDALDLKDRNISHLHLAWAFNRQELHKYWWWCQRHHKQTVRWLMSLFLRINSGDIWTTMGIQHTNGLCLSVRTKWFIYDNTSPKTTWQATNLYTQDVKHPHLNARTILINTNCTTMHKHYWYRMSQYMTYCKTTQELQEKW